jgi:hypothetical protein
MQSKLSSISFVADPNTPKSLLPFLPAHVERKIAARWQEWVPWVRMHVLRCGYDAARMAAETARMRQQHSQHLLLLLHEDISMRVARRHGLDDPRITDEARAVLLRAAMERKWKARASRQGNPASTSTACLDSVARYGFP